MSFHPRPHFIKRFIAHILLITNLFLVPCGIPIDNHSYAVASEQSVFGSVLSVFKKVILKAATVGIDQAGSTLLGPSWGIFKQVMQPVFEELSQYFPDFFSSSNNNPSTRQTDAQAIIRFLESNVAIQQKIQSGIYQLQQGQKEILNNISAIDAKIDSQGNKLDMINEKLDTVINEVKRNRNDNNPNYSVPNTKSTPTNNTNNISMLIEELKHPEDATTQKLMYIELQLTIDDTLKQRGIYNVQTEGLSVSELEQLARYYQLIP